MWIFVCLLYLCLGSSSAQDPCTDYKWLNQSERSTGYTAKQGFHTFCDSTLATNWYRFSGVAGEHMPTTCPDGFFTCNTMWQIWLNGSLPAEGMNTTLPGCVRDPFENNCCVHSVDVGVKTCAGGFVVYHLRRLEIGCPIAYCAGEATVCDAGDPDAVSCDAVRPEVRSPPGLHLLAAEDSALARCTLSAPHVYGDVERPYNYTVVWGADDDVRATSLPANTLTADLDEQALVAAANSWLWCEARAAFYYVGHESDQLRSATNVFVGMQSEADELLVSPNSTALTVMNSSLHVPVVCTQPPCNVQLTFRLDRQASLPQAVCMGDGADFTPVLLSPHCTVNVTDETWNNSVPFALVAQQTPLIHTGGDVMPVNVTSQGDSTFWRRYSHALFTVRVGEKLSAATCSLSGAGWRIATLPGCTATSYVEGEFVFYKNNFHSVEVHVMTQPCDDVAVCACAVAVSVHGNTRVIDSCRFCPDVVWDGKAFPNRTFSVRHYGDEKAVEWMHSDDMDDFQFYLPCGAMLAVTVDQPGQIAATLHTSGAPEAGNEAGLCGTHQCGVVDIDRWRIKHSERSLYYGPAIFKNQENSKQPKTAGYFMCDGTDENEDQPLIVHCKSTRGSTDCDKCDHLEPDARPAQDFPFSFDGLVHDPGSSWPSNGWSEAAASDHCSELLADTRDACSRLSALHAQFYQDTCVQGIKDTGATMRRDHVANQLRSACETQLRYNTTTWLVEGGHYVTDAGLHDRLCPGGCSEHGDCHRGVCACAPGWMGSACGQAATDPPAVFYLEGPGLCDITQKHCQDVEVTVVGQKFYDGHTQCVLESDNGGIVTSEPLSVAGNTVKCRLLREPSGPAREHVAVRVRTNSGAPSASLLYTVYNSTCLRCEGGGSAACSINVGFCYIDGACWQHGEAPPDNRCLWCDGSTPHTSDKWSTHKSCHPSGLAGWAVFLIVVAVFGVLFLVGGGGVWLYKQKPNNAPAYMYQSRTNSVTTLYRDDADSIGGSIGVDIAQFDSATIRSNYTNSISGGVDVYDDSIDNTPYEDVSHEDIIRPRPKPRRNPPHIEPQQDMQPNTRVDFVIGGSQFNSVSSNPGMPPSDGLQYEIHNQETNDMSADPRLQPTARNGPLPPIRRRTALPAIPRNSETNPQYTGLADVQRTDDHVYRGLEVSASGESTVETSAGMQATNSGGLYQVLQHGVDVNDYRALQRGSPNYEGLLPGQDVINQYSRIGQAAAVTTTNVYDFDPYSEIRATTPVGD